MKTTLCFLLLALFPFCLFSRGLDSSTAQKHPDTSKGRVYLVKSYIHHISDINYRDGEYKIEFWLNITCRDTSMNVPENIMEQIQVKDAKEYAISFIPQWIRPGKSPAALNRRTYKINCTMVNQWSMKHYPFDDQQLDLLVYTINPVPWVCLEPAGTSYSNNISNGKFNVGNGWYFDTASLHPHVDTIEGIFFKEKKYSAIHFKIPLIQDESRLLFIKLFLGMYVAFFVAFIAMFIPVESEEPRFGLPVGGLFAAIGNKYIIEALLPVSTDFTLVDTLHSVTIVSILFIIAYSALLIYLNNSKKYYELHNGKAKYFIFHKIDMLKITLKDFNRIIIILLSIYYLFINLYFTWLTISQSANSSMMHE